MKLSSRDLLRRLGAGESIAAIQAAAGIGPAEFDAWWRQEIHSRLPTLDGRQPLPIRGRGEILRDEFGIPHVFAETDDDLLFSYGYAIAQDRLWQLDYLRRKAHGRLAEILGPEAVPLDLAARTIGIGRIAARETEALGDEASRLLKAFCDGINAYLEAIEDRLPIEFDLLDYRPEPWSPVDSLAIMGDFRCYLTVRFPVIAIPELARRTLGDGPLYDAFLAAEEAEESIVPSGSYPSSPSGEEPVGEVVGDPQAGEGSNNWVVAPQRTATGTAHVASDPHIGFGALSCWYQVHLCGGSFNVVGMAYTGVPPVMFGRNQLVAWGITNNICSQRDLYAERTDPAHPGCFFHNGRWVPAGERTETIGVRGSEPVIKTIRSSTNGPIVDEILPEPFQHMGPVSLRWLGASPGAELASMFNYDRATTCDEFREALCPWRMPTFSFVFADTEGHIGFHASGRLPIRHGWRRGYRDGSDPRQSWHGLVPFDRMPALADPPSGWIRTANHRTAPPDFPYPLGGTWGPGYRARRIRELLEADSTYSRESSVRLQHDVVSLRAAAGVPLLLETLAAVKDDRVQQAVAELKSWDYQMTTDSVAATLFEVFFTRWSETVAAARFEPGAVPLVAGAVGGLAMKLLSGDDVGWFKQTSAAAEIAASFKRTLDELAGRLGPEMSQWSWGRIHRLRLRHPLSERGALGTLLDRGDYPVPGSQITVCSMSYGPNFDVYLGANYRLIADVAEPGLWAIDAAGQSGNPASPHYCDQGPAWLEGTYHFLPLDRAAIEPRVRNRLVLDSAR